MSSSTPNLNLSKPDAGDTDWASEVNGNFDTIDSAVGVIDTSGSKTFVILPSSSTAAEINTALNDFNTVYLKPGTYSLGSTNLNIGEGKKLIGLGNINTVPVVLSWSGSPASRHVLMQSGWIENVVLYLTGAAHTSNIVEGHSSYRNNVVKYVNTQVATSASIWSFYGVFAEIGNVSIGREDAAGLGTDGIRLTGTPAYKWNSNGGVLISNFFIYAAPTYGIYFDTVNDVLVTNGYIDCYSGTTDYGFYYISPTAIVKNINLVNVRVSEPGVTGFHVAGTASYDISINFTRCSVYGKTGSTDRGFYANYADGSSWTDCNAEYCNGTANQAYGAFCVENSYHIQVSSCRGAYSTNTNNSDFWFNVVSYSTFTGLESRGSYYGAWWYNDTCLGNAVAGVTVRAQTSASGYPIRYHGSYSSLTSLTAYDCAFEVRCQGNNLTISSVTSYSSASNGVYLQVYYSSCSSISSYDATNHGIVTAGSVSSFSALTSYSAGSYNLYLGATSSSYSGLTANSGASLGVYAAGASSSISSGSIVSNSGRGLEVASNSISISGLLIYANGGHGVYLNNSYCSIDDCQILQNATAVVGYGIYATANAARCRISDNLIFGHNGASDGGVYLTAVANTSAYHNNNDSNNGASTVLGGWNLVSNFVGS